MQANWSLILNVLLLVGVVVAIGRLMNVRRQSLKAERYRSLSTTDRNAIYDGPNYNDDIIAVRKVNVEPLVEVDAVTFKKNSALPKLMPQDDEEVTLRAETKPVPRINAQFAEQADIGNGPMLMMFLLAKENRQFIGYELLQTVLASGLRFGDDGLFHRHQFTNGDGPIICSLASATATGVFDLQNIGAFSVRGLCLYMQANNRPELDAERFSVMLDTARQLSEGLDAHLLDEQRRPLTEENLVRYYHLLQLNHEHLEIA
ncbi:MAG: cell division protein ZipA C-terminal FtsZ-binding domain-containing protein [Legionella sp.]|uniref:cell division protein ZipA C-terminal FtsZ-binding domain-containing protein n=1 Tax=Legionella sp. TaxID=459 RepID=UPI0039E68466